MGESGRQRAAQFGWPAVTAKVEEYYGFVIRRLAASGALPRGFNAPIPEAPSREAPMPGLWAAPHQDGGSALDEERVRLAAD